MKYYARKISDNSFIDTLLSTSDLLNIESDFLSNELKTTNNKLSTWEIEIDKDVGITDEIKLLLKQIIIFSQSSVNKNFSIILISEELLSCFKLSVEDEIDFGKTAFNLDKKMHRNVNNKNVNGVLKFINLLKKSCEDETNIIDVPKKDIHNIVMTSLYNSQIDSSKIGNEMARSIEKNIILNKDCVKDKLKYKISYKTKEMAELEAV